ncbi:hypothetical protein [Noviherbaspirillum saxi]|uniref:Uncharacterized protein n=1 Tax=Noviherbaspirillum saxi TaxID=2320863 RepID=A0A3A3FR45_9BURK|nr:hypothetical protein [Noviherbaspirillum saxi]RJF95902.1 hypothetical protein D3871_21330 [Noviherbaspirillum saxi]
MSTKTTDIDFFHTKNRTRNSNAAVLTLLSHLILPLRRGALATSALMQSAGIALRASAAHPATKTLDNMQLC